MGRNFYAVIACILVAIIFCAPFFGVSSVDDVCSAGVVASSAGVLTSSAGVVASANALDVSESEMGLEQNSTIKWFDLNASERILKDVYKLAVNYYKSDLSFDFVQTLAYLATKNGNNFNYPNDKKNLASLVKLLQNGKTIPQIMGDNKYYKYYLECFEVVFGEYIGEYVQENDPKTVRFGLKAYFPIAKNYWYNHYDDFGSSRSYGFRRIHLGHDMFGSVGAPIIAIEGGTIEEIGWNQYGGWRIGIRSFDKKRYYYYAHLRKDRPFAQGLKQGDSVQAGCVIGYLGKTGYSTTQNTNLKTGKPHLHWGLQLIFDGGQRETPNEIWVDVYALTNFLSANRAQTLKDQTKEHRSTNLKRPI